MEYESDILKRLIKTYGVVGNPRYISEIIKEFIVQGKERFPNLFTYQSDWLAHIDEFGINPSYTVSYTGQFFYAPNTLERPVKSAILSGQTLVNLCDMSKRIYKLDGNKNIWQKVLIDTNPSQLTVINYTDKIIHITLHNRTTDTWVSTTGVGPNSKFLVNCGSSNYLKDLYGAYSVGWSDTEEDRVVLKRGVVILEGDYSNQDIPYFEGMQSVKMPVLTTTGKNLFDGTWEDGYTLNANGEKISTSGNRSISSFIEVNESFSIYSSPIVVFRCYDEHKNDLNGDSNSTPTSGLLSFKPNTKYIRVVVDTTNIDNKNNFMIVTSKEHLNTYEPYKSNILTVNEPIELRGIGDVKDELNLLTGEAVERIGEIVLNEDITGYQDTNYSVNGYSAFRITSITNIPNGLRNVICDKVKYYPNINLDWTKQEEFFTTTGNLLFVKILSTKASNFEEFRSFLSSAPITIQYELAESIKTVDLTILGQNGQNVKQLMSFNGGTHFNTGSLEGSPLPSVTVSVETDLKETLKVCSLEGNTM